MPFFPPRIPDWWDRETDSAGNVIRADVRAAVQDVWKVACIHAEKELGDIGEAAEIMEGTVAQISRYLERLGSPLFNEKHNVPGLLLDNFKKELARRKRVRSRLELSDDPDALVMSGSAQRYETNLNLHLDKNAFLAYLHPRAVEFFRLRDAGYDWKYIAEANRISVWRAKHFYTRAWRHARNRFLSSAGKEDPPDEEQN